MSSLKGKTLFITGSSRGIGKQIALRAAADGANIVVAAKTAEPDPRLPGTIHATAEEVEKAGGHALALVVDVRDESQVEAAVSRAASHFGGIDILVNNASAINIDKLLDTPIKRYDLMMNINVRGSFLCARACLPHLLKAANPHVLSLSPPVNMRRHWFSQHTVYTTSKYAMAMLALGIAEEFREQGVAGNTLWPRTVIDTAALNLAAPGLAQRSRQPRIMAEAAHWILTQPSRDVTGQSFLDEDILRRLGMEDFSGYATTPGVEPEIDLFVDR